MLHEIGRGGMASVYAVRHHVLGTRHALKVLHTTSPEVRDRLLREGRYQARIDAAHIVPVTDVFEVDGAPALLMPHVEGCSLAELMADHRLSEAETLALFAGVVAGVAAAHAAGIVHRDLKPANVLLEMKRGVVVPRVADFGIAKTEDLAGATRTGMFLGTPAYAAPEQLADASSVDHRADLWALGVVLVEMLTGERPFQAASLADFRRKVAASDRDTTAVPERWRSLVDALLQPDPERRLGSASEVASRLDGLSLEALTIGTPVADVVRKRVEAARQAVVDAAPATAAGKTFDHSAASLPHDLPHERDAFVGRVADLDAVDRSFLAGARLVTLLGPGGTGKTRLAIRYGWDHLAEWPGGVWFCDLTEARSADGIAHAVASMLQIPLGGDGVAQLGHAISSRGRCLLIFDNFEQVARHAEATLGVWLDTATEARILATSREVLHLDGEQVVALAPLLPAESEALFVARAVAANQAFTPTDSARADIRELVTLLDHLPLAIELAAARIRLLPPSALVARMNDRFRLLTTSAGRRDRHATLRATLDWSWNLLATWERAALAQLSVFEGGFDLEAVDDIVDLDDFDTAPWALDVVQGLVDKSLVRAAGDGRFGLLMSVREYAAERLDDLKARVPTERRHGQYYARFGSERALDALDQHGGVALRRALAREVDNLAVACRRAVARGDGATAAETALAADAVLKLTGPVDVSSALLAEALATAGVTPRLEARLGLRLAHLLGKRGRRDAAWAHAEAALAVSRQLDDAGLEARSENTLGLLRRSHSRPEDALRLFERAVTLAREAGDQWCEVVATGNLVFPLLLLGRLDEALALAEEVLRTTIEVGDRWGEGCVLSDMGVLHHRAGAVDSALRCLEAALAPARETADISLESRVTHKLGEIYASLGEFDRAHELLHRSLVLCRRIGMRVNEPVFSSTIGEVYLLQGRSHDARPHLEAARRVAIEVGDQRVAGITASWLALAEARVGHLAEAQRLFAAAGPLLTEVADEFELGLLSANRAELAHLEGDAAAAAGQLREAVAHAGRVSAGPESALGRRLGEVRALLSTASA